MSDLVGEKEPSSEFGDVRGRKEHFLKTWPMFFDALLDGSKTFEVRKNDRSFTVGDTLELHEFVPQTGGFTGRSLKRRVTYILEGSGTVGTQFGVQGGYVVMGLAPSVLAGGDEQSTSPVSKKPAASVKATGQKTLSGILDEMEERANKATRGPWHYADDPLFPGKLHCIWGDMTSDVMGRFGTLIAKTCFAPNSQANADLLAASRTDVPALVKALRLAEQYISELARRSYRHNESAKTLLSEITAILTESDKNLGE